MIFVDSNVFMYGVGRPHPLQDAARAFFIECTRDTVPLCTSAEVLQELFHAYIPAGRLQALDASLAMIAGYGIVVWPLEAEDIVLGRQLLGQFPALSARDLCHLASCRRRGVSEIMTFDQALAAAASKSG